MPRLILAALAALVLALPAQAVQMGDDGLHKTDWMRTTFMDLREDLADANAEGKRLLLLIEQRGCIYCRKMHEEVFPTPEIDAYIRENYFVVQVNMFGDVEMTDFDGEALSERDMIMKWGIIFTPTMMFFPESVPDGVSAGDAAVATMPGAFGKGTTLNLLTWVVEHGYETDENFQKYHARKVEERQSGTANGDQ